MITPFRPRFCYALTTHGQDLFADMTYVSVMFLRRIHPDAEIICLLDERSHELIHASKHSLLDVIDRNHAVETRDGSAGYRNRFVKTQVRQIIDGDFVFLDSDTLTVDSLHEFFSTEAPLAGVANHWNNAPGGFAERDVFESMNWPLPTKTYMNSGVVLFRDREPTRKFGLIWHQKWRDWSDRGRHNDQGAFNSALIDSGIEYEVLGERFNAQIGGRPRLCREPVALWHFFSAQSEFLPACSTPRTILDEAIDRFRANGRLTTEMIDELCQWPYPWYSPTLLDRLYIKHIVRNLDSMPPEHPSRFWLAGYRKYAIKRHLMKVIQDFRDSRGKIEVS